MRLLASIAAACVIALPALADEPKCRVLRQDDGLISQTEAVLVPQFKRLVVQQGPIFTDLVPDKAATLHPVGEFKDTAELHLFWVGGGVAGKEWRGPGGVAYALGGFAFRWPNFDAPNGFRIDYLRAIVRMGEAKVERDFFLYDQRIVSMHAQTFKMHEAMVNFERPNGWDYRTIDQKDWPLWQKAFEAGGTLTVEFLNGTNRAPLASASFHLQPLDVFKRRAADDIRDFRQRADPKDCSA